MMNLPKSLKLLAFMACLQVSACSGSDISIPENAIVSTTLCADGYLHKLSGIEPRLAALSWQSRSALSQTPEHLKALPQADNDQERRLNWSQATQISSAGGGGDIDLQWGEDFETVWKNFHILSTKLNVPNPTASLKFRLKSIQQPAISPRILYLNRSGGTAGPRTFVDAVIKAAGGINIIETPGWQSPDTETLIRLQPDIILTSFTQSDYAGVNDRTLRHEALADKIKSVSLIDIPGRYWTCAGPGLVDATEQLNQAMAKL